MGLDLEMELNDPELQEALFTARRVSLVNFVEANEVPFLVADSPATPQRKPNHLSEARLVISAAPDTAHSSGKRNPTTYIGVVQVKARLVDKFVSGRKELRLVPFTIQLKVLLASLGEQKTAAGWNLKGPRRVLVPI
jgi:hypothetical protein